MVSPIFTPQPPVSPSWAPAGGWYNAGASSAAPAATQQPTYNPNDPNAYLNQLMAVYNSPIGQSAQAAQQQTIAFNIKEKLAAMQAERDRITIEQGKEKADLWYKQESLKLAQDAHALAVQTQNQNYGLAQGALTGTFNGQPTLAAQNQQQQYAIQQAQLALSQLTQQQQHELAQGTLNLATLTQQQQNAIQQAQLGLTQAGITGELDGRPTLAAIAQQQNFGLAQAGITGQYGGQQTLAAQGQMFNQGLQQQQLGLQQAGVYGYGPGGNPTLAREQAAANTSLQAAQLGASLRGPGDWAQFLQAQNAVAGSPASALVASAPGGLGAAAGPNPEPMTLGKLLTGFGVMPGQGPSQQQGAGGFAEPWTPQPGAPQMIDGSVTGAYSQPYSGGGGVQNDLAQQWAQNYGGGAAGGQPVYAGGSPNFNEQTGSYSSAPAGGMRPSPQPVQNWAADGGGYATRGGGGEVTPQRIGYVDQQAQQGWNPYSLTGAIGQAAQPWQPTAQQLGFQNDDEMNTVKGYFNNPNQAPVGWWESKNKDQKAYLGGLNQFFGGSNDTFQDRYANSRTRQGAWNAAV